MEFSERLVRARKAKNLSQEALAEAVGVSRQAVSKWECGEAKPDLDRLITLCRLLDVKMNYLCLGEDDLPERKPRILPIALTAVGMLLCIAAGMLIGALCFPRNAKEPESLPAEIDTVSAAVETATVLEHIELYPLTEATVVHADLELTADLEHFRISVMTGIVPPEAEARLQVDGDAIGSVTVDCLKEENCYIADISNNPGEDCLITFILHHGDEQKSIPLFAISADGRTYNCQHLWK